MAPIHFRNDSHLIDFIQSSINFTIEEAKYNQKIDNSRLCSIYILFIFRTQMQSVTRRDEEKCD